MGAAHLGHICHIFISHLSPSGHRNPPGRDRIELHLVPDSHTRFCPVLFCMFTFLRLIWTRSLDQNSYIQPLRSATLLWCRLLSIFSCFPTFVVASGDNPVIVIFICICIHNLVFAFCVVLIAFLTLIDKSFRKGGRLILESSQSCKLSLRALWVRLLQAVILDVTWAGKATNGLWFANCGLWVMGWIG